MVTAVACFAGGHRKIYTTRSRKLDIKFRKLVRTIRGPPGGLDGSAPWHDILHGWNARVLECVEQAGVKLWSQRCLEQYWKLATYIPNLPDNRCLKRALAWTATAGRHPCGCPLDPASPPYVSPFLELQVKRCGGKKIAKLVHPT